MKFLNYFFSLTLTILSAPIFSQKTQNYSAINPQGINIVRDTFGVAHIYAKTDAEVAYGFAWANAEDDFKTMQETLIIGKGLSGIYEGKEGAAKDFLNHALGIKEMVEEQYSKLTPQFLKYLNAYCQGINKYAEMHPKEILIKKIFPVTEKDVLRTYSFISCFLAHVQKPIKNIVDGTFDKEEIPMGSNAFAFNPSKTVDGRTYLAINPHQPLEGPFSFREAHLCSEEGLNIIGAFFPVGTSIFMGNNEHLGWGMTFNEYDLVDTYKLKMHSTKKLMYEFDGEWKQLEERKIKLKVKIAGPIKISVSKSSYWSVYGCTLLSKSKKDFYSVRTTANMSCNFAEQFYYANKAKNFDEFYTTLNMQGFPRFNVVYADKEGNIFYIDNGRVPKRSGDYNWTGLIPGNTSKTLWKDIYKEEELPQVKNPACGYVFNMNNTAFIATCPESNLDSLDYKKYPKAMGLKYTCSNRSVRFMELMSEKEKFDFETFKKMKFDSKVSENSPFLKSMGWVLNLNPNKYPEIANEINHMKKWDRVGTQNSVGAAYLMLSLDHVFKKYNYGYNNFFTATTVDTADFVASITYAKNHFLKHFGKTDVTLGELQRHVKGNKNVPMPGFPDVLAATYSVPSKNGRYKGFVGESYVHFVSFSKNGPEVIETLVPFGSSNHKENKHYTDQMELFSKQKTKKMTFSKNMKDIPNEKIYHPQ
ncbi:MAG: penicillin acylase family protein [Bacteroidia bacterium]